MAKYISLLLLTFLFCNCTGTKQDRSSLRVSVLRGPSAIAFAEWMIHPPVINGKTVAVQIADSPEIIRSLIIKEETDLAVLPMISAVNLYNKGVRYPLAGCPIWGTLYLLERERAATPDSSLFVFGAGTTPDILTRYYLSRNPAKQYRLNYSFPTPREILQALSVGKVNRAVFSEPFLSMALSQDTTFRIVADLNQMESGTGLPQTAVVFHPSLRVELPELDSLLQHSCRFANEHPEQAIRILEEKGIFAPRTLTPESIRRCRINYRTALQSQDDLLPFLKLVYTYEPKAIGGRLPDRGFISDASPLSARPELIPSLPRLFRAFGEIWTRTDFYHSILATIGRGTAGMLISLLTAFVTAWLFARSGYIYRLFNPLLVVMRSVPVISFILLALVFLDPESIPLMIAFLAMYPLLAENLAKGIRHLHPGYATLSRLFRIGRWNRLAQIVYPQLKPFLYSGLASAAGFGWRAIIMGEVLSQCRLGIGSEMKRAQNFIDVPELIAWTIVAVLVSYLFDKAILWLSRQKNPIRYAARPSAYPAVFGGSRFSIKAVHIGYTYGIRDFTRHFLPGKSYGISAPSGTGKTTLLALLDGTLPIRHGMLEIDRTAGIASVFQEPELLPHLSALENVMLPLARTLSEKQAAAIALDCLEDMEMTPYAHRLPAELSYGQQQRVALARALAFPSPFLFMDEPFKGLDRLLALRIIRQIRIRQQEKGQLLLFTSHNAEELAALADETIGI